MDSLTDSDGDLLPDSWEIEHGLNRHSAAILGTALSEQSLDSDEDGLNNLDKYLLGEETQMITTPMMIVFSMVMSQPSLNR